ncbi:FadR/GntR family transcriptional regulator [Neobacillus sp. PS3-12]|jgi:GntR family transcriptional regulator, transcriptional repressor for pyruvate dehydrogenase complex|uniref:FadR/GntR family transcriptional regulator n=1 Tax=Neobacillus sp. PS3-12 TaxID=3070677 RepID=UPI0027DEE833|nr:FadR/GntR family transcriptional regulator [Neobacillus sp. PS3-12]WML50792.1 FadR/GntR family transcriptional regulator [Neobacillus sp. PS3-12]
MNFNEIKKTRVYEQVIEQIKGLMELGKLKGGDKLPSEREMAGMFNVSRSVIREAMSVLNAGGVLDIRPGIGVFIVDDEESTLIQRMDRALKKGNVSLQELLEVRQGLESQAAYLAAHRATPKDIERLEAAYHSLLEAVKKESVGAKEDFIFHEAIIKASKNEILMEMLRLLSDRLLVGILESRSNSLKQPQRIEDVLKEHKRIVEAISNRDADLAKKLMFEHLENVKNSNKM